MKPTLSPCPVCGHSVSTSAAACPSCGHGLQPAMFEAQQKEKTFHCADCGTRITRSWPHPNGRRCNSCGGAMNEVIPRTGPAAPKIFGPVLGALLVFFLILILIMWLLGH